MNIIERNKLVESYLPLARSEAWKKYKTCPVSYDELESAAFMGLVVASRNYDPERETDFSCYARIRVKGSILDYLREMKWGNRTHELSFSEMPEDIEDVSQKDQNFEDLVCFLEDSEKSIVVSYYQNNESLSIIARKNNLSKSAVYRIIKSHKKTIKNMICRGDQWCAAA